LSDLPARTSRSVVEAKAKVKEAKEGRARGWEHERRVARNGVYPFLSVRASHNFAIYFDQILKARRALLSKPRWLSSMKSISQFEKALNPSLFLNSHSRIAEILPV
jgi:hypothetical protein